jgi:hypothetical protein
MISTIFVWVFALFCIYRLAEAWITKNRCDYCGQIVGHEPSCPWSIVG